LPEKTESAKTEDELAVIRMYDGQIKESEKPSQKWDLT